MQALSVVHMDMILDSTFQYNHKILLQAPL